MYENVRNFHVFSMSQNYYIKADDDVFPSIKSYYDLKLDAGTDPRGIDCAYRSSPLFKHSRIEPKLELATFYPTTFNTHLSRNHRGADLGLVHAYMLRALADCQSIPSKHRNRARGKKY